jgi:phosphoacetylglucosamine mutase
LPNPSVGDAIGDLLLIEVALDYLGLTYESLLGIYQDYESRTSKIKVKNKQVLKVTEIEDRVVYPPELQTKIDEILKKYEGYKAFVRASGTEDVLRLHVEAKTMAVI